MSAQRTSGITGLLALAGLAVSVSIAQVHGQIAASQVSACDISETVSCSVVLSSRYAYVLGIPVAWGAIVAYAGFLVLAIAIFRTSTGKEERRLGSIFFAMALVAVAYSVFLAAVSVFSLGAVCLLCSSLYVVNTGLLLVSGFYVANLRRAGGRGESAAGFGRRLAYGAGGGLLAMFSLLGWEIFVHERVRDDPAVRQWYSERPLADSMPRGGHARGNGTAPVVIAEFSDFECGHCARAYRNLKSVLPRYGQDVRLEFHHFPLDASCNPAVKGSFHAYACRAAVAAECAAAHGKFWPYHDLLFENQKSLSDERLIVYAEKVGLQREEFVACLESDAARDAVERDIAQGERLGVQSTPTLFVNRRIVRGALEENKLEQIIRIEREQNTTDS